MDTVLFENKHIKSTYFADKNYILNYWTGHSRLTNQDFQKAMTAVADKALNLRAKGILVDTREFNLTIPPEVQEWYDAQIVPKHLKAGILKMAFLLPEDIFAYVSIEQTMDEQKAQAQQTKYFETYEEAENWIIQ